MTRAGVLALQGGFAAHVATLRAMGVDAVEVRRPAALHDLGALVLPGGESTAQLVLMGAEWAPALRAFSAAGGAILGTCAGAILLAREVAPSQPSLGLLDATVARNGYGRQRDSFEGAVTLADGGSAPAVFIRAPRFLRIGPGVEVLASHGAEPVAVRQGRTIAATYHPELAGSDVLHQALLRLAVPAPATARAAS